MPSRQSLSKATGGSPARDQPLVEAVERLEQRHVGAHVVERRSGRSRPASRGSRWRQIRSASFIDGPHRYDRSRSGERLEVERLDEALGRRARAAAGIHAATWAKRVVVAPRLAVRGLVLHAEVAAARLLARERIAAHQLAELEEVGHAAGALELLVQLAAPPGHASGRCQNASRSAATSSIALRQPLAAPLEPAGRPTARGPSARWKSLAVRRPRSASSLSSRARTSARAARASGAVLVDRPAAARRPGSRRACSGTMK